MVKSSAFVTVGVLAALNQLQIVIRNVDDDSAGNAGANTAVQTSTS